MPSNDRAAQQKQQPQQQQASASSSSAKTSRPAMQATSSVTTSEQVNIDELRKRVKAMEVRVKPASDMTEEELSQQPGDVMPQVTLWRRQQDLFGGATFNSGNLNAATHIHSIEHSIQTAMQIKDRAFEAGSTFAEAAPWPRWVMAALYVIRPIVEIYETRGEQHLGPYQACTLERAKFAVDLLEDMWASDLQKEEWGDESDEEGEDGGDEQGEEKEAEEEEEDEEGEAGKGDESEEQ